MPPKEPEFPDTPPTWYQRFLQSPLKFFAFLLFTRRSLSLASRLPAHTQLRIVCISDTHNFAPHVPDGDILIHAGDMTRTGSISEIQDAVAWIRSLPHRHKLVIAGNHDEALAQPSQKALVDFGDVLYLEDSLVTLKLENGRELKIYGSPKSVDCGGFPWQNLRGEDVWSGKLPENLDILITHGPPKNHLDLRDGLGDKFLLHETIRVKPKLHVFGHVHWGSGMENVVWDDEFEQAYDRIMNDEGGWTDFVLMIRNFHPEQGKQVSRLVNAGVVNGDASKLIYKVKVIDF